MTEIRTTVDLRHPPERVWRALTDRELLPKWFGSVEPRPSSISRFELRPTDFPELDELITVELVELDPPHRIVVRWPEDGQPTQVVCELTPTAEGCRLTVTQGDPEDPFRDTGIDDPFRDSGIDDPWRPADPDRREQAYRQLLDTRLPAVLDWLAFREVDLPESTAVLGAVPAGAAPGDRVVDDGRYGGQQRADGGDHDLRPQHVGPGLHDVQAGVEHLGGDLLAGFRLVLCLLPLDLVVDELGHRLHGLPGAVLVRRHDGDGQDRTAVHQPDLVVGVTAGRGDLRTGVVRRNRDLHRLGHRVLADPQPGIARAWGRVGRRRGGGGGRRHEQNGDLGLVLRLDRQAEGKGRAERHDDDRSRDIPPPKHEFQQVEKVHRTAPSGARIC
ncbi:SRPBCC domain-containing protein [Plantactinospora sp. S1510]|uniref:SRPBCC domain-containing protein n=1 Tax=Plantactinospora alkalitolerans TaxID=2789879 RepID=A0ABS0GXZ0_9ACTN|nr:SRPBCC domain-containing protein [Plantactinospora alkalitolerans]MBF9131051.1 SRPBCC domain-containing protein [Plantactinospora alkalitolerans]